jgi:hypothetical protein
MSRWLGIVGWSFTFIGALATLAPADAASASFMFDAALEADACTPSDQCCKICSRGKACGNTCISRAYECHKGRGCACNEAEICR